MSKQVSGGTRRPESSTINSVDDRPNRLRRDRSDRVQVGTGAADGRTGVDADHSALADKKAGVVDPPGPVGLDIGEDAVVDLLQLRRARGRDVVVDGCSCRSLVGLDARRLHLRRSPPACRWLR